MNNSDSEVQQPNGQETAQQASAGESRKSGSTATREAMASPEAFRLSEEALEERDKGFTRPRKPQGPPLEGDTPRTARAEDDETPPPDSPSTGESEPPKQTY